MGRIAILDNRRSFLSKADILKYKCQITKIKSRSVLPGSVLSTFDIANIGSNMMKKDNFRLVKGQIDI